MPSVVTCSCGQAYQAADHLAGKQVHCPACGEALDVPRPAPVETFVACRCGQRFKAAAWLAGTTVPCPACRQPLTVPLATGTIFDDVVPPRPALSAPPLSPAVTPAHYARRRSWTPSIKLNGRLVGGVILLLYGGLLTPWIAYNLLIELQPVLTLPRALGGAVFCVLLLCGGFNLVWSSQQDS